MTHESMKPPAPPDGTQRPLTTERGERSEARGGRPTIRDVAIAAGVSQTTVSHALNGKGRVTAATRDRVREVASSLGYLPSRTARSLAMGRTQTLGLSLPQVLGLPLGDVLRTDLYGRISILASQLALERDHVVTILPPFFHAEELARFPVDGLLVFDPCERDPRLPLLERAGVPFVCLGLDLSRPRDTSVRPDIKAGADALLAHLVDQGARSLLLLGISWDIESYTCIVEVADKWAAATGIRSVFRVVGESTVSSRMDLLAAASVAANDAMTGNDPPDAIVGLFEGFGASIAEGVRRAGRTVPGDVLVAQDVDDMSSRTSAPPITAFHLHPAEQAAAAVDVLVAKLGGEHPQSIITPVSLRIRESSCRR